MFRTMMLAAAATAAILGFGSLAMATPAPAVHVIDRLPMLAEHGDLATGIAAVPGLFEVHGLMPAEMVSSTTTAALDCSSGNSRMPMTGTEAHCAPISPRLVPAASRVRAGPPE